MFMKLYIWGPNTALPSLQDYKFYSVKLHWDEVGPWEIVLFYTKLTS